MRAPVCIIGGGPVGGYVAAHTEDSMLIEKKKFFGSPVRCTGVLTTAIESSIPYNELKASILNTITETIVHVGTKHIQLPLSNNHIICNTTFEEQLIARAQDKGNTILSQHTYQGTSQGKHRLKDIRTGKQKEVRAPLLVGADGPQSYVNTSHNIHTNTQRYMGYQIRLKVPEHDNKIHFYPNIGTYAWFVPETDNIVRLGVCSKKNPQKIFQSFRKQFKGVEIDKQAGFIPIHKPLTRTIKRGKHHKAILLGDAAGHVKNTTGGGIIPGIHAASQFTRDLERYKGTPPGLARELYGHFLVHNILKSCSEQEWHTIQDRALAHFSTLHRYSRDQILHMLPRFALDKDFFLITAQKLFRGKLDLW